MNLYPRYTVEDSVPVASLETLLQESTEPNYIGWGLERDFTLPTQDSLILKEGSFNLNLNFMATEPYITSAKTNVYRLRVTPFILVREEGIDRILWSGNTYLSNSKVSDKAVWRGTISTSEALDIQNLVLNVKVGIEKSTTAPNPTEPGGITISSSSLMNMNIIEGENQALDYFTRADFIKFQKRERFFVYSVVDLKERIYYHPLYVSREIKNNKLNPPKESILTTVKNYEDINLQFNTEFKLRESITSDLYSASEVLQDSVNYITNVEIGDYALPPKFSTKDIYGQFDKYYLRRKEKLDNIVENLKPPKIINPENQKVKMGEAHLEEGMADGFVRTIEMLKSQSGENQPVRNSPDYSVVSWASDLFVPSGLRKETPRGDWHLLTTHASSTQSTFFQTRVIKNSTKFLDQADILLFTLRFKPDNTFLSASHNGVLGKVILKREASSTDEEIIWMWNNARTIEDNIFRVQLDIRSNSSLNPSFFGKSAGILVT
jgi:RNA-binding protein YlmH